jgi:Flp pilus assembly protein TadG
MSNQRRSVTRGGRRSSKGQVMAIFALIAVLLFAVTGLAVDAGLSYFSYNGAERAAAAGALAGVPYMPNGFGGTGCSSGTADAAACAATARDGFANGSMVNGSPVTVTVARYPAGCGGSSNPCSANKLTVTVGAYVQPTFLRVLGFGSHKVVATDTAFYLPPISLGQPGAQLGSTESQLGTAGNYYFLRSEGYGTDRGEGDAYDPNQVNANFACQQGVTENSAPEGASTDVHALSANLGTDVPDATLTGAGVNLLPERGGYNFAVAVPSTVPAGYVRVYNPAFAPDGGYNPSGGSYNLHEQDGSFSGNSYTDQYSAMEYTVFQVNDIFDHSKDTPLSQVIVDPLNVTISGGAVVSFVDVRNGQTLLPTGSTATVFNYVLNNIYHGWMDVGTPPSGSTQWVSGGTTYNVLHVVKSLSGGSLAPGSYRLRVDMLDYQGLRPGEDTGASPCSRAHKGYTVQLGVPNGGSYTECVDPACRVSALDELAVYTPIQSSGSSGFSLPLFNLPADYAGQTINFYIYDVGDVSGNNQISILNPDQQSCGVNPAPCLFTSATGVPVYDLGYSLNTAPAASLLVNTADSCATPTIQPSATQALVNTAVINGCGGRSTTDFFNARWLLFQLQIPSNYQAGNGGWWDLNYSVTGGTATDTFTLVVNYASTPVHLT